MKLKTDLNKCIWFLKITMLQCVCETNYPLVAFSSFVGVLCFFFMNQLCLSITKNTKQDLYDSISETEESEEDIDEEESKENNQPKPIDNPMYVINDELLKASAGKNKPVYLISEKALEQWYESIKARKTFIEEDDDIVDDNSSLSNLIASSNIPVNCPEFTAEMDHFMKYVKSKGPDFFYKDEEDEEDDVNEENVEKNEGDEYVNENVEEEEINEDENVEEEFFEENIPI